MKALILLVLSVPATLVAQTVTATDVLSRPFVATIVDASGATISQTVPAGGAYGLPLSHSNPAGIALAFGQATSSPTSAMFSFGQIAITTGGRSVSLGPAEVLCSLTASAPLPVQLRVQWFLAQPGVGQAQVQLDINNDGSVEYAGANPGTSVPLGRRTLGATPLVIRVTMQTSATSGAVNSRLVITAVPDVAPTIQTSSMPCASLGLTALPAFDGSLEVATSYPTLPPLQLLVLGLAATPTPLPFAPIPGPCLLIPRPDAILTLPPSGSVLLPTQALHGTPLWMQAVGFNPAAFSGLLPSWTVFVLYP
jgi:hypothetical protein